jgi:hypothetical protein
MHQIAHLGSRAGVVIGRLLVEQAANIGAQALAQGGLHQAIAVGHPVGGRPLQVGLPDRADGRRLADMEPAVADHCVLGAALLIAQDELLALVRDHRGIARREGLAPLDGDVVGVELDVVTRLRRIVFARGQQLVDKGVVRGLGKVNRGHVSSNRKRAPSIVASPGVPATKRARPDCTLDARSATDKHSAA